MLPEEVIDIIASRARHENADAAWELVKNIREHPEKFSEKAVKTVARDDEDYMRYPDSEEIRRLRSLTRTDSSRAILEEIHRIDDSINALKVQLSGEDGSKIDRLSTIVGKVDMINWIVIATLILVAWKMY